MASSSYMQAVHDLDLDIRMPKPRRITHLAPRLCCSDDEMDDASVPRDVLQARRELSTILSTPGNDVRVPGVDGDLGTAGEIRAPAQPIDSPQLSQSNAQQQAEQLQPSRPVSTTAQGRPVAIPSPPRRAKNPLSLDTKFQYDLDTTPIGAELGLLSLSPPLDPALTMRRQALRPLDADGVATASADSTDVVAAATAAAQVVHSDAS